MFFCRFFHDSGWYRLALIVLAMMVTACSGPTHRDAQRALPELPAHHRQEVVMTALGLMGTPYRYGGIDPGSGFDCSGLVAYVFGQVTGLKMPRSASSQAASTRPVERKNLSEGDLVFFNTTGRANSHVGIYIGDGRFVNAPTSGGRVRIDHMDNPYFARRFNAARTLFAAR